MSENDKKPETDPRTTQSQEKEPVKDPWVDIRKSKDPPKIIKVDK